MADERPWYFRDKVVIVALLLVMPLALPMVWFNPHYTLLRKVVVTLLVGIATYFSIIWTMDSMKMVEVMMQQMK